MSWCLTQRNLPDRQELRSAAVLLFGHILSIAVHAIKEIWELHSLQGTNITHLFHKGFLALLRPLF